VAWGLVMRWFRRPEHGNAKRPATRRNLLVVRAGDDSLHPGWLAGEGPRDFDLLVSYYGRRPGRYRNEAEHYHEMQGPRWPAHNAICREHPEILVPYDRVCFACDDLVAELDTWNRLFATCWLYGLDLAQPAIEGHVSYEITRPVDGCVLRRTNFVENMCPVFSAKALMMLRDTFGKRVRMGIELGVAEASCWGCVAHRNRGQRADQARTAVAGGPAVSAAS
jgi:hypothetical protein